MHPPHLIEDLAIILMAAGVMTLIFRMIGQPVVLGYLIAGFLVGPHFQWIPTVLDNEGIKVWGEIGVIFLLFGLGLEFSLKKLMRVGAPASVTAIIEVLSMIGIGLLLGYAFGWKRFDSLFLGAILAISSTTIIIRAFEELEMKNRKFVHLVFGVLIVEDLVAILLLVALSTFALSRGFSGIEIGVSALKLVFFLTLWYVLGIFLIPTFLTRIQSHLRAEMLLIVSVGLCFMMVVFATKVGFSAALGAFMMGSILAETLEGDKIALLIQPVKDLFGAIFFVSVGMLIDPHLVLQYAFPIAIITMVMIIGKILSTTVGALIAGQGVRHSVQSGMSLAQIGEFSFIIAGLGLSLNVTSDFLFPIAISVSAVSTFTTPYLIRSSDLVIKFLESVLPAKMIAAKKSKKVAVMSQRKIFLQNAIVTVLINGVVVTAIFLVMETVVSYWFTNQIIIIFCLTFLISSPFLWAMIKGNQQPTSTTVSMIATIFRGLLTVMLCVGLTSRLMPPSLPILLFSVAGIAIITLFSAPLKFAYQKCERQFLYNFQDH